MHAQPQSQPHGCRDTLRDLLQSCVCVCVPVQLGSLYIHATVAAAACALEILLVVDDVRDSLKQYDRSPPPNPHAAAAAAAAAWVYNDP